MLGQLFIHSGLSCAKYYHTLHFFKSIHTTIYILYSIHTTIYILYGVSIFLEGLSTCIEKLIPTNVLFAYVGNIQIISNESLNLLSIAAIPKCFRTPSLLILSSLVLPHIHFIILISFTLIF